MSRLQPKRVFFILLIGSLYCANSKAQSVAINTDASAPNASALLDIKSTSKGLLIPRMTSVQRTAIATPASGLLVYDITTSSFWFYNGSWNQLTGSSGWNLTGNAGTNAATNFIGTTDKRPLRFRVNNIWAGGIDTTKANVFLGIGAGQTNTGGEDNTAVGNEALFGTTTGGNNTVSGYQALYSNSVGFNNTASGYHSLYSNVAGSNATAIGTNAMLFANSTTTAYTNFSVAVGFEALRGSFTPASNTGNSNTAIGYQAMISNSSGNQNTALGVQSLFYNTTGSNNTATGQGALYSNVLGSDNTANGYGALAFNTAGANTATGAKALYANTTGDYNTASGFLSLTSNIEGSFNTSMGASSMQRNTKGSGNVAIGDEALNSNTTGSDNVAIGAGALINQSFSNGGGNWVTANVAVGKEALFFNEPISAITGVNNTALGYYASRTNTTGHENVAVGSTALLNNTTGSSNTVVGYAAMYSNSFGSQNVAIGQGTLYSNNGNDNTATGYGALSTNSSGANNTANGVEALSDNTTGSGNVAVGANSLSANTVAAGNTAIGALSMSSNISGTYNTAIGYQSLSNNVSGSGNTALGFQAGPLTGATNISNTTCIGNGAAATADNQLVLGNAAVTQFYCYGAFTGTTALASNLTVLNTGQIVRSTSSRRYKKDIVPLSINTSDIYKLRPVSYGSITDNIRHFGLIAEEVAELIPELAYYSREKDVVPGSKSEQLIPDAVQYPLLSVLLLNEMQKHERALGKLQETVNAMAKLLAEQQAEIKLLKEKATSSN